MIRRIVTRFGYILLGLGFLFAIIHIGQAFPDLNGYAVEYGYNVNLFGPREGAFFLVYGLCAFMAAFLFTKAVGETVGAWWAKNDWASVRFGRLALVLSVSVVLMTIMLRLLIIREAPMTDDEHAYLFSARMLQSLRFYWTDYPQELAPFLNNQFLVVKDLMFSQYYPGFPALLAIGLSLGSVTLVNPIMAGLGVLVTFHLAREISGSSAVAFIAALLLSLSPSYLFSSAMLLPHTASLVFGSLFVLMIIRSKRDARARFPLLAGLAWAYLLFNRPLTAAVFGIFGAVVLMGDLKTVRKRLKPIAILAGLALGSCALFLAYNRALTGSMLKTTYTAFAEFRHVASFNTFSLAQIFNGKWTELLVFPFLRMNFWTFGWASSFIFLLFCPAGPLRRICLGVVCGVWLSHLAWPNVGVNMSGAAHYLEAVPFIAMMTASALHSLYRHREAWVSRMALAFPLVSAVVALAVFFPWVSRNLSNLAATNLAPYQVEASVQRPAIIFSTMVLPRQGENYLRANTWTYYRKNNRPDLTDDILWLNDLKDKNIIAMRLFPERHAYRLNSRTDPNIGTVYFLEEIGSPGSAR